MMINIILADDHPVVRDGLRMLLNAQETLNIIAEASDGIETVQLVETLKPHVLVLDVMMPGLNGMEVTRQVKSRSPSTEIVILSMHNDETFVIEAFINGASAYVLKMASTAHLIEAIRAVSNGEIYLSPSLSKRAMDYYVQKGKLSGVPDDPYDKLTNREREVLQSAAEGLSNNEIAERLSISPRTVEMHRANLMNKLDFHNQTDIIRFAIRRGFISLDNL